MPNWRYIRYRIEERWERLELREKINRHPKAVIGISAAAGIGLLLIAALPLILRQAPVLPQSRDAWFYDLNTQTLFAADSRKTPPVKAPSGDLPDGDPAGVRAHVLPASGSPTDAEPFICYLEKFTPEGKKLVASFQNSQTGITEDMVRQLNNNRLIRRPADTQWVTANSEEGRWILQQASYARRSREMKRAE